jgi:hypothetical protein
MPLQNGLYCVTFGTPLGQGTGVAYLSDGQLHGGDSSMFYSGSYEQNGDSFEATVRIGTHTKYADIQSVFGVPEADIQLKGQSANTTATTTGSSPQAPGISFSARLDRIAS